MLLHELTWSEVEDYLKTNKGIVIPIGSTEQHGPNGLLGTDALCPEVIAQEAGEEAGFLVGPTFNAGVAQHHLGFPGTITLRPSVFIAALQDWISSLVRHGFQKIYFLNGHGGNVPSLGASFSEAYMPYSLRGDPCPFALDFKNWWLLPGMMSFFEEIFEDGLGVHATPWEVAVTYYARPHAQKSVKMTPRIAPGGPIRDAVDYQRRFPDGRVASDPAQASVEKGRAIVSFAKKALIKEVETFFQDDSLTS